MNESLDESSEKDPLIKTEQRQHLLRLLEVADVEGQTEEEVSAAMIRKEAYKVAFERLDELALNIISAYRQACSQIDLDPGEISVYIVGGRTYADKSINKDSDIDIAIVPEDVTCALEAKYGLHVDQVQRELNKKIMPARWQVIHSLNSYRDESDFPVPFEIKAWGNMNEDQFREYCLKMDFNPVLIGVG